MQGVSDGPWPPQAYHYHPSSPYHTQHAQSVPISYSPDNARQTTITGHSAGVGTLPPYGAAWLDQRQPHPMHAAAYTSHFVHSGMHDRRHPELDYGQPFANSTPIPVYDHTSAHMPTLDYVTNAEHFLSRTPPEGVPSLQRPITIPYPPNNSYPSSEAAIHQHAASTSWPISTATRRAHVGTGSLDMGNYTSSSSRSMSGTRARASLAASSPASCSWSDPVNSRDNSPSRSIPPSPLPPTVVLPHVGSASDSQIADFINESFPEGIPNFMVLREELRVVVYSDWKRANEKEPHKRCLLQFVSIQGQRWECLFYVDGERCPCSSGRIVQALEHIRRHIKLEPYVCAGRPCPESTYGCGLRYSSLDPLRKHRKGRVLCGKCGRSVLPGNMQRHLDNNCHDHT